MEGLAVIDQHHSAEHPSALKHNESNGYVEKLYPLLGAGGLDAVVDDSPIAKWFSHSVPGLQFAGVLPGTDAAFAIMVRKGNNKLRAEIDFLGGRG
jgi:ABC-type amino acid transport substrate-binding protein